MRCELMSVVCVYMCCNFMREHGPSWLEVGRAFVFPVGKPMWEDSGLVLPFRWRLAGLRKSPADSEPTCGLRCRPTFRNGPQESADG